MNKSIYIAAFAALALTACSNDGNDVFDQSAAERLEQYKKDYADVLTSDGGLWTMEYFSNSEEPGYVFVMKFDKNGSVEISANHKWIDGEFRQETSLWKMIADNGPVLSFNSYNKLFHIFSDPANIVGPDAPTGEAGDIDETGFGHEGDYEFQVMEVSDDRNTVRLLGKKRMYDIFLHRLDASTDVSAYLEGTTGLSDFLSPHFGYANLIAADGERFTVTGLETSVVSIYPTLGDAVSQTRTGNGIFTYSGFRFMEPLEVPRADESNQPLILSSFSFKEDGSLESSDGARIVGPYPTDVFVTETLDYTWKVDLGKAAGDFASMISTLSSGIVEAYPTRTLESIVFGFEVYDGDLKPTINVKLSGTKAATYYLDFTSVSEDGVSYSVIGKNSQALTLAKKTEAIDVFVNRMVSYSYVITSEMLMAPEELKLSDSNNNLNSLTVDIE